jgi:pentatricopeptide repeat protein
MYGEFGDIESARSEFDRMPQRDSASYSAMLAAYASVSAAGDVIDFFQRMNTDGIVANESAYTVQFGACAQTCNLAVGEQAHAAHLTSGLESVIASTALIDMYGKCDKPDAARAEFDRMPQHDAALYGAMLDALGVSGRATEAVAVFHGMLREGITPTEIELVCLLSACSHGGLVDEALTLRHHPVLRCCTDRDPSGMRR